MHTQTLGGHPRARQEIHCRLPGGSCYTTPSLSAYCISFIVRGTVDTGENRTSPLPVRTTPSKAERKEEG